MFIVSLLTGYVLDQTTKYELLFALYIDVKNEFTHIILVQFDHMLPPNHKEFVPLFVVKIASDSAISVRKRIIQVLAVAV